MATARGGDRVALGFSVHTGWAALVAVSSAGAVLERRRIEMLPDGQRFVYHAASELAPACAEWLVREAVELAGSSARAALAEAREGLALRGHAPVAAGIVVGEPAPSPPLAEILASHARIHTAEGALYREALRKAGDALGLCVVDVRARELEVRAARALGLAPERVGGRLAEIGKGAGRPWAKDQKAACLAALVALAE